MELVLIESPFAGDREGNIQYLKACLLESCSRGEAPYASHLFYTQFLEDDIPEQRAHGIAAGLAWGASAAKTIVYCDRGISKGMRYGIAAALAAGRPVEYRLLGGKILEKEPKDEAE